MALQFHIQPVAENPRQPGHQGLRRPPVPLAQMAAHRPVRPTTQTDHILGMRVQFVQRHMGKISVPPHVEAGIELHQMLITGFRLRQQDHWRGRLGPLSRLRIDMAQVHLAPDDRLHPRPCGAHGKLQRSKQVVGIGQRQGRHLHART